MPTLEELFKSKQLPSQGGKTAEEAYAIQNSKKIRISSSNPLVSTVGMLPAKGARALLGIRKDESLLEEELTGLRMIRTGSIPFIYGTDIARLTLKTTDSLSKMKEANLASIGSTLDVKGKPLSNPTSGLLAKVGNQKDKISKGLGLPFSAIPTYVDNSLSQINKDELGLIQSKYSETLAKIKEDAAGTALGRFLAKNAKGTPDAMARNVVGGAIKEGKKALGQKLFGSTANYDLNPVRGTLPTGITPQPSNELTTKFTDDSLGYWGKFGFNYGTLEPSTPPTGDDKEGTKYSKTVVKEGDDVNDLSTKQIVSNVPAIKFSEEPERKSKFETAYFDSKIVQNKNYQLTENSEFLETKRGMYTTGDKINQRGVYTGEDDRDLDDLDFITLKFTSLGTKNGALRSANFRATISGLSETFSPSWDSAKFVGSPFSYYTYSGIERSVTFNFKVYSLNAVEHKIAWDKLNFLAGLVYPADYYGDTSVKAPIIKFTLGDMYQKKAGFIESLSYTIDDNTPWQVSDKEQSFIESPAVAPNYGTKKGIALDPQRTEINMKQDHYKLPTIVDVSTTIKFIENKNLTGIEDGNRKFYTFTPQT